MKAAYPIAAAALLALAGCGDPAAGGDTATRSQIRIVGSSTVYPFTTAVAERFAQSNPSFRAPIVESTGTGAGMKLFCSGVGAQYPDVSNASRRIKAAEVADCHENGVNQVIEVQVGIDGLVFVESNNAQSLKLGLADIYRALAATPYGQPNRARTWKDVNPALPAVAIQVYGPPPTSGTRDALAEMILEKGCDLDPRMKALKDSDSDRHKEICTKVREDGLYVETGENDNLLVQKVSANPGAVGVLGYSFLEENTDRVRGMSVDGVAPSYDTISNFSYPGARPLYIYVKGEHLNAIPGLKEFLAEYARGWVAGGYLVQRGLIAAPADVQAKATEAATRLIPLDPDDLS